MAIFIATISGAILPVLGLLVPYRGIDPQHCRTFVGELAGGLFVVWLGTSKFSKTIGRMVGCDVVDLESGCGNSTLGTWRSRYLCEDY
ncbi:hypothetical protein [Geitlerinema sp. PCC 9228]|uniref:hypothetical protein n=1 Tax=Geitlerinema sp. PCC 9228 TaxID=111611 RepID=UPI000AD64437|nr:hypothetical protein [Geitlerinema sp. PCC 9228]